MDTEGSVSFVIRAYDRSGFRIAEYEFTATDESELLEHDDDLYAFLKQTVNDHEG